MIKYIFTNSFGILLSRILGFIRDLLMALILGANVYSDMFFVAFKLPNLFRRIFSEGAFTQVFIPNYTKTNHKIQFSTIIFLHFLAFLIFLSIVVSIFSNLVTSFIAIGFSDTLINQTAPLVRICFFYLPLIFIVTFLASLLQYKNHFFTTSFATSLLNISLIFALLISKDFDKSVIVYYLSYAVVVGGILQVIVHLIAIKKLNIKFLTTKIKIKVKNFYNDFFNAILGNSTAQISAFIDTWLASFLVSGSISYLYYANRVFQLPLALFAIATSTALFPNIAKKIKNNKKKEALILLKNSFWFLFIILFVATSIGIIFADEIVKLLFLRGEFSIDDANNTSIVLSMYLIGLIPFGLSKIFLLWLFSYHRQKEAAKISTISLVVNIVFSFLLFSFGAKGLALASSISGFVLFFLVIKSFGYKKFYYIIKK